MTTSTRPPADLEFKSARGANAALADSRPVWEDGARMCQLTAFGVASERIYVDHGLSGTNGTAPATRQRIHDEPDAAQGLVLLASADGPAPQPWRLADRLSDVAIMALVASYLAGQTIRSLALWLRHQPDFGEASAP